MTSDPKKTKLLRNKSIWTGQRDDYELDLWTTTKDLRDMTALKETGYLEDRIQQQDIIKKHGNIL